MRRLVSLLLALAGVLALSPAAAASDAQLTLPDHFELGRAAGLDLPGRTTTVSTEAVRSLASWGGQYLTPAGEPVTIRFSDAYPPDEALAQQWADFLGSLVHGPEISRVSVQIAPLQEVQGVCGFFALACYSPSAPSIVAPGEDPDATLSAEAVLAHEYGHHVAASRLNPPWPAGDYGTKRWASYLQVCRDTQAGSLFPGAADRGHYRLNPGEGYAEAYRVLNERRLGLPESPWEVVSSVFYPDDVALAAIEQDVLQPWSANTVSTVSARFTRRGPAVRTYPLTATLDGNVSVTIRAPATARLRVDVLGASGRLGSATVAGGARTVRTTACGSRTFRARVTRLSGFGAYRLVLSRP